MPLHDVQLGWKWKMEMHGSEEGSSEMEESSMQAYSNTRIPMQRAATQTSGVDGGF